jgi:hypothetical protein
VGEDAAIEGALERLREGEGEQPATLREAKQVAWRLTGEERYFVRHVSMQAVEAGDPNLALTN